MAPKTWRADFGPLLPAEAQGLARMGEEKGAWFDPPHRLNGAFAPPPEGDAAREVHAAFVAFLHRGGGPRPPPRGLRIAGAWIGGPLDLERGPEAERDLSFLFYRFEKTPNLRSDRLGTLNFTGSHPPGLDADRLETRGGVFRGQAVATGEARFLGARIGGNLDCVGAGFERTDAVALHLDRANASGAFFPSDDESACGPARGDLLLNRRRCDAFTGGPVDASSRLGWLALQEEARVGRNSRPQPYGQLAKVFRDVLIRKDKLQRRDRRRRVRPPLRPFHWLGDVVLAVTVRCRRAPTPAFAWLLGLWTVGAGPFHAAALHDAVKPDSTVVLRADEWAMRAHERRPADDLSWVAPTEVAAGRDGRRAFDKTQLARFLDRPEAGSYPLFNALIHSAEALLPVAGIEMQSCWFPNETAERAWAAPVRRYLRLHIALGWGLSLLAVAGFSGLVKPDRA